MSVAGHLLAHGTHQLARITLSTQHMTTRNKQRNRKQRNRNKQRNRKQRNHNKQRINVTAQYTT